MEPMGRLRRARWAMALRVAGLRRFLPPYIIGRRNILRSALQAIVDVIIP